MRTLSSTFATAEEAEDARSRLYLIGVEPDNVVMRDLGEAGGAEQGIFLSAKVMPDQVSRANAILNSERSKPAEPAAPPPEPEAAQRPVFISKGPREQVTPPQAPGFTPVPQPVPAAAGAGPAAAAAPSRARSEQTPLGRLVVIFALIILAGILLGYLLGSMILSD